MKTSQRTWKYAGITAVAAALVFIALPDSAKTWAPQWMRTPTLHYGLDLVGGTQLDFRISERELDESIAKKEAEVAKANSEDALRLRNELTILQNQKTNLTEAIRTVLERRINSLGVSEAIITPADFGGEKHLLVECPGVVDVQDCISTVGKTIQLEFKEEFTEATAEYEQKITALANTVFAEVQAGKSLATAAEEYSTELAISYTPSLALFQNQLPSGLERLWNAKVSDAPVFVPGTIPQPIQTDKGYELRNLDGYYIARVVAEKKPAERTIADIKDAMKHLDSTSTAIAFTEAKTSMSTLPASVQSALIGVENGTQVTATDGATEYVVHVHAYTPAVEQMKAKQILISYSGAFGAAESVTRSKDEAKTLAEQVRSRLIGGEDFSTVAKQVSDAPNAQAGGVQDAFTAAEKDPAYAEAAFALQVNEISTVIETSFGYYIVQAESVPTLNQDMVDYSLLTITKGEGVPTAQDINTKLTEQSVSKTEDQVAVEYMFFSKVPTGWKDTELNGQHFRSATVTLDQFNKPTVQINFNEEGAELFQQLTKNNIGKRIAIFVGGELISAPNVQQEISGGTAVITGTYSITEARAMAQDLNTGAIPAPIYLAGQRTIEATLGAEALHASLRAALIGVFALMVYMILMYRVLGVLATIALGAYAVIFLAILKLPLFLFSDQYVVLSLAGLAGIILSLGMAVDANVLIFERMREEMRTGKQLQSAANIGFTRAWPSIRDGNASTLITCAILFMIGTSIIKGFSITLSLGVLISMFSAIVITKALVLLVARTPMAKRKELFM